MRSLNFNYNPWQRCQDFYDYLLDYEIDLPSISRDQFSSTTQKWFDRRKLFIRNHQIFLNKDAFRNQPEEHPSTYSQLFTKRKKNQKRETATTTTTASPSSKYTNPSVTFPMTQLHPVSVTLTNDLTGWQMLSSPRKRGSSSLFF